MPAYSTATNPRDGADAERAIQRRILRKQLQGQSQRVNPASLGPVGGALYNLGSTIGDVRSDLADRIAQRQEEKRQADLDRIANVLMADGKVPGVEGGYVRKAVAPDADDATMAAAMREQTPMYSGGLSELQLRNTLGQTAGKQSLQERMAAERESHNAATEENATERNRIMSNRPVGRQGAGAAGTMTQNSAANVLRQYQGVPDSMEAIAKEVKATTPADLPTWIAAQNKDVDAEGNFTAQVPVINRRTRQQETKYNPDYRPAEKGGVFGTDVSEIGKPYLPVFRTIKVPFDTAQAFIERQNAVQSGTPMVRHPKGGQFMAADAYQAMLDKDPAYNAARSRFGASAVNPPAGAGGPAAASLPAGIDGTPVSEEPMPSLTPPLAPNGAQTNEPSMTPPAASVDPSDPRIEPIKQLLRAGRITRDQARQQIAALSNG